MSINRATMPDAEHHRKVAEIDQAYASLRDEANSHLAAGSITPDEHLSRRAQLASDTTHKLTEAHREFLDRCAAA